MKQLFTLFSVCFIALIFGDTLWATSYHTISIDGNNDFATDEDFSGSNGSLWYFTWDADNFYFAANNNDIDDNNGQKWIQLYIDTDPKSTATNGTGSTTGINYNTQQPGLPFTANYHFRWKTDDTFFGLEVFNGTNWTSASNSGIEKFRSGTYVEFKIPRANLGNPDGIYLVASMINETSNAEFTFFTFPTANTEGYDINYNNWFTFELEDNIVPDLGTNFNRLLPVSFGEIKAIRGENEIKVAFTTHQEENNHFFNIERSTDSRHWQTLGQVAGAGTTQEVQNYTFADKAPAVGTNYYRIQQVDYDGAFSYSAIVSAQWKGGAAARLFPNPAATTVRVDLLDWEAAPVTLSLYDMLGRMVLQYTHQGTTDLDISHLPTGAYLLKATQGDALLLSELLMVE